MIEAQPVDRIRDAIENKTGPGRRDGDGWSFRCPAHSDRNPSLSLGENNEHHALLYCHSGCDTDAILSAIGFTRRDLYPVRPDDRRQDPVVATYKYYDETRELLYEVERTASKRFRQRRPDPDNVGKWLYKLDGVRRVLYRLPYVLQAISEGQTVYVVEGEKDVHAVEAYGAVGTCNPGGAGKWRPEYNDMLRGAHVVVVIDRDKEGQGLRHGRQVANALMPGCASVTLVQPAAGKDTTDHRTAGLALDAMTFVPIQVPEGESQPAPGPDEPIDDLLPTPVSPAGEAPVDDRRARIRLEKASAFQIKPVRWVWDARMPLGEITLIPGREGVGKSTFLAWMAAMITNGNLPGVYHGEPRAVLYAATEDSWGYTIAPRMLAAGANLDLVYRIDVMEDDGPTGLSLPRDCRYLPEVAAEVKAAVLMCDPILSMVDDRINTNYAGELRGALTPLKAALEKADMAGIGLVHFNKSVDTDVMSKIAGSRAWGEVARAVIAIARDNDAEDQYTCVVDQIKNNLGRTDLPKLTYTLDSVALETKDGPDAHVARIRWTGETDTGAEEILARKPRTNTAASGNIATVLDHLDEIDRASSPREIADACDLSRDTTKKILLRLANAGTIDRVGTGLYKAKSAQPGTKIGDSVDWRTPRNGVSAPTRMRDAPFSSPSPPPTQVRGGDGDRKGGKAVPGDTTGTGTKGGKRLSPPVVPTRSCRRCHAPFAPEDEGQSLCLPCLSGA